MKKLHLILILCLPYILFGCNTMSATSNLKNDNKLTIVTTDVRGAIHAKMIVGKYAGVSLLKTTEKKLGTQEKELINAADILITTADKDRSIMENALQEYHGTHIQLKTEKEQQIVELSETNLQIETIRDAVAELDPKHRGYYYDTAGNYENNIQETYGKLRARINEYNKNNFLLFSDEGMDIFLRSFGLDGNFIKQYPLNYFGENKQTKMKEIQKILEDKNIKIAFIKKNTPQDIITFLDKSGLTLYTINDINEDTSAWGYLRLIEKLANTFVTAFNAYD